MAFDEERYVICHNGVFSLPESIFNSLATQVTNGFVYLREDQDVLTISTIRLTDGRRRVLNTRYRSRMFVTASRLAIVDLKEAILVMAVEKRTPMAVAQAPSGSPPAAS